MNIHEWLGLVSRIDTNMLRNSTYIAIKGDLISINTKHVFAGYNIKSFIVRIHKLSVLPNVKHQLLDRLIEDLFNASYGMDRG